MNYERRGRINSRRAKVGQERGLSKSFSLLLVVSVCLLTSVVTLSDLRNTGVVSTESAVENIALLCLESVFPTVSRGSSTDARSKILIATADTNPLDYLTQEGEDTPKVVSDLPKVPQTANSDNPAVLIYHTHATESFMPVDFGNFHTIDEFATVREVGDVMAYELDQKGIGIVHDKTLHDSPSYNQSYSRSLETAKSMLAKYSSAKVIIDLHRDASAYSAGGKTVTIEGQKVAPYSLVVGNGNENSKALKDFANKINAKAESMYPGFGGRIIEKDYKYNQYIFNNSLLLEVGNNRNDIEEVRLTAKYFANVLAEVLKEM